MTVDAQDISSWVKDTFDTDPEDHAVASTPADGSAAPSGGAGDALAAGGSPVAAPGCSADPNTQCDPAADPNSPDYKAGYQDGAGGKEQNGTPRDGAALASYTEGYQAGQRDKPADPNPADPSPADPSPADPSPANADSADYQAGYKDGAAYEPKNGTPRDGAALDAYNAGYEAGYAKLTPVDWDEAGTEIAKEGFAMVFWHMVAHKIVHVLALGSVVGFVASMTAELECDTRLYRFKCPTCGASGDPECTLEEAQADAEKHQQAFPDHKPEAADPFEPK